MTARSERLVLAVVFMLSLPAVTTRIYASDEIEYFAFLRSIWFDGDVSFQNEYQHFYDAGIGRSGGFHETFLERETETGLRINFATIGCAILWSPFYGAGHLAAMLMNAAGYPVALDGYSAPYVKAVCYGSALYGFLAILLSAQVARRLTGAGTWPALAVWLGTPLLFYTHIAPAMSHACSAFMVAAFVVTWLRVRRTWSIAGLAALGAIAGVMAMVREQDLFFAAGPAVDLVWQVSTRRSRQVSIRAPSIPRFAVAVAAGTLAALIAFTPQLMAYMALNGRPGPSQLVGRKMTWTAPHALGVLLSPSHGFLFWTPLFALALLGLVLMAVRMNRTSETVQEGESDARTIAACMLVMIAVQVYVAGSVESWTVAGAFGQRRFVALTVILTVGLAALLQHARARRTIANVAVALCIWWNLGLMAQFGAGLMDRQRLELSRNAYNTFVVIPQRLPELAWRYLFDRGSFYRPTE